MVMRRGGSTRCQQSRRRPLALMAGLLVGVLAVGACEVADPDPPGGVGGGGVVPDPPRSGTGGGEGGQGGSGGAVNPAPGTDGGASIESGAPPPGEGALPD